MDIYSGIAKLYNAIVAGLQGNAPSKAERTTALNAPPIEETLEKRIAIETPASEPGTFRRLVDQMMEDPTIKRLFPELDQSHFPAAFRAKYADAIAQQRDRMRDYPILLPKSTLNNWMMVR